MLTWDCSTNVFVVNQQCVAATVPTIPMGGVLVWDVPVGVMLALL